MVGGTQRRSGSMRMVFRILEGIEAGALTVAFADGERRRFAGTRPGPEAEIVVHRQRLARRVLIGGSTAFGESYMDGDWDSPDLAALLELIATNADSVDARFRSNFLKRVGQAILHAWRRNSRLGSRRNIAYHYDLGNEFYRRWLDPGMVYSAAVFEGSQQDLEEAQRTKIRRLLERLDPRPGQHLLEIGCGWGALAVMAARDYGMRVTGITLSREQAAWAQRRVAEEGLGDRVDIRLVDYRDVTGRFDHIASCEMFEAVGERFWPVFFRTLRDRLVEGGRAALQVITIDERRFDAYRSDPDFIQRYIFPGGMLPTAKALRELSRQVGLTVEADEGFGRHYARTLGEWARRFRDAWPDIQALGFDDRFRRMWQFYLGYCEGGFRAGSIDVRQIALRR